MSLSTVRGFTAAGLRLHLHHVGARVGVGASSSGHCQLHSSFSSLSSMSSSPSVISYRHQLKVPKDNRSFSCSSYISSSPSLPFINLTFSRKLSSSPPKLSSSKPPSAPSSLVTGKTSPAKLSKPLQALRYKARPVTRKKPGGKVSKHVIQHTSKRSEVLNCQFFCQGRVECCCLQCCRVSRSSGSSGCHQKSGAVHSG